MAVDSNIENWNVADPRGSLGPTVWAMGSVLPYTFSVAPDFTPTLNTDLLADARQTTPTTVAYTVRPTAPLGRRHPGRRRRLHPQLAAAQRARLPGLPRRPGRVRPDLGDHRQPDPGRRQHGAGHLRPAVPGLGDAVLQHRPALPGAPGRPPGRSGHPGRSARGVRLVRRHRAHLLGRPAGGAELAAGPGAGADPQPALVRPPGPARPGRAAGHRRTRRRRCRRCARTGCR